jgi:Tetrapyrrole (Corrin/Porphyrin) Methylases
VTGKLRGPFARRQLYVIGLGVKIPGHTTIEAAEAMSRCARIYSIVQEPSAVWLPSAVRATPVVNLLSMYIEGALRIENYQRVANAILEGLKEAAVVGYVTYGNPLAYDSVAQMLVRNARRDSIPFQVVPGISSIDTILCDLGIDMAPGVQIYEASWLVASRTPLNPSVAAILLQLGHFGSARAHYRDRRPIEALKDLVEYLSGFYQPSHAAFLVQSSNSSRPAAIKQVRLDGLCEIGARDWAESVYIPALQPTRIGPEVPVGMERA